MPLKLKFINFVFFLLTLGYSSLTALITAPRSTPSFSTYAIEQRHQQTVDIAVPCSSDCSAPLLRRGMDSMHSLDNYSILRFSFCTSVHYFNYSDIFSVIPLLRNDSVLTTKVIIHLL